MVEYSKYQIRHHESILNVNRCYGNSLLFCCRARNLSEAVGKYLNKYKRHLIYSIQNMDNGQKMGYQAMQEYLRLEFYQRD